MYSRKKAVALKYDYGDHAPVVTASGAGVIADNIIKMAEEHDVPVVFNKELTELMSNVKVGDDIPVELYDIAAEVIAFVTRLDQKNK